MVVRIFFISMILVLVMAGPLTTKSLSSISSQVARQDVMLAQAIGLPR